MTKADIFLLILLLQASFTASYSKTYSQSECLYIKIRGYNKAGLSSIVQTEVFVCEDPAELVPRFVVDSSGKRP